MISFNDMNTNKINPKPFYNNYKKKNINNLLNSLAILLTNTIILEKYVKLIIKKQILFIITLNLKIYDLDMKILNNIYGFFKDFISNKDNCVKAILGIFIDIGIFDVLETIISNKNYEVIQSILDVCLLMMKECNELTEGKGNIITYI